MKIVLFTQEDPFYVKVFFDEFLLNYQKKDEIAAVVISKAMGKQSLFSLIKQMLGLYGFYYFIKVGFSYVFHKLMSKKRIDLTNSNLHAKTYSVKQTVEKYGIPVIERSDLNSPEFIELIKQYNADLFISIASPIIFKEQLIDLPKIDCINIHNAPLPYYRGMLPNFWQLYNGEKESGITIHRIEKGIDTGDIIKQIFLPIAPDESLDELIIKTKKEDATMLIDVIEDFHSDKIRYTKMKGKGSYFTFPVRKDALIFKQKGKKLF